MRWQQYIHRRPEVLVGKPVFIGTRISVEMILEELAAGAGETEIVAAHPSITVEHIRAALEYAAAWGRGGGGLASITTISPCPML